MKVVCLGKPGLLLLFGSLFVQSNLLLGDTPPGAEQDAIAATQPEHVAVFGLGNNTISLKKLPLLVLGIGAVGLGLSIYFSPKRSRKAKAAVVAPASSPSSQQMNVPIVRLSTSSALPHQVPRNWSEDIVPLKLKASDEARELESKKPGAQL
jgi:hypothetical protein